MVIALSCLFISCPYAAETSEGLRADLEKIQQSAAIPVLALGLFDNFAVSHVWVLGNANADTPLRWGSISKTYTAMALSHAVDARKLSWDQPIREVLEAPPWQNPWQDKHPVRFRDLAELCAGVSDLSFQEFNDNQPHPRDEVLATPRPILWPPGLQHSYTNVAPGLSAWVVERLTKTSFDDYMGKHVFNPLGMAGSSYSPVAGLPGGYKADGLTQIPYWHMTFPAAGGLNASLNAMLNGLKVLLNQGERDEARVVSEATVRRMVSSGCAGASERSISVGYGAGMYGRVRQGFVFYGHGGDADGYRSRYGLLPEHGRGYVVLINTDNPRVLRRIERRVEQFVTRDLIPKIAQEGNGEEELSRWVGRYYPSSVRFGVARWRQGTLAAIDVSAKNGNLVFGEEPELVAMGSGRFRRQSDPVATIAFFEDSGVTYLQGELGNYVRMDHLPAWLELN